MGLFPTSSLRNVSLSPFTEKCASHTSGLGISCSPDFSAAEDLEVKKGKTILGKGNCLLEDKLLIF
jgi:hypothetical protein